MHVPGITRALLLSAGLTSGLYAQSARDEARAPPEVRQLVLKGVDHVDAHALARAISTRQSKCRSIVIKPFCWVSHSPTFEDKHYLDRNELRHPAPLDQGAVGSREPVRPCRKGPPVVFAGSKRLAGNCPPGP